MTKLCGVDCITITSKNTNPTKLILLIHGYGADASDLYPVGENLSKDFPEAEIILPNGFDHYDEGNTGRQWFALNSWDIIEWENLIYSASEKFELFITQLLYKYNLTINDILLFGFSQGAMVALHVGIQCGVLGIAACSGLLVSEKILLDKKTIPGILLIHGDCDTVIPVSSMLSTIDVFKQHEIKIQSEIIPGCGHYIDNKGYNYTVAFFKKLIENKNND